jgi:LacI family transcriptional regulator
MARMKDVAERARVAESTVSHVINNTRFVTPETRERVMRAMAELNFHKNALARRLARGRSDFLGLIISDIENPFYPGLIKAFESTALERGYEVLLSTTNYDPKRIESAFRRMIENQSPGVAVMTSGIDASLARVFEDNEVASVFLDSGGTSAWKSSIRINYAKGALEAVNYLYNLGHRSWAMIAGPQNRHSHVAFRQAVEGALARLQQEHTIIEGDNTVSGGERAVSRIVTQSAIPTVILCSNDLTAIGALQALIRIGLRVPDDVSVVGADDIAFSQLTQPALTTVRIPRGQLGQTACEILERMLREKCPGTETTIDTELAIRDSTGPVRAR